MVPPDLMAPGRAVADLEEAHQARRTATARQRFAAAAQLREVRTGARAVFEQPRLADPEVHDSALVHQIVRDRLDEAGMRLRMLVGRARNRQLAGFEVDIEMTLAGTVDAIGPVHPGVEPLRAVRRAHLGRQHPAHLVIEAARIFFGVEIAALPAPISPGAGKPVENLLRALLAAIALFRRKLRHRLAIGLAPPQEFRHVAFDDGKKTRGHTGLAEIFLGQHIAGDLRPVGGNLDILRLEHQGTVGIPDLAARPAELDSLVGALTGFRESTSNTHDPSPIFNVFRPSGTQNPQMRSKMLEERTLGA